MIRQILINLEQLQILQNIILYQINFHKNYHLKIHTMFKIDISILTYLNFSVVKCCSNVKLFRLKTTKKWRIFLKCLIHLFYGGCYTKLQPPPLSLLIWHLCNCLLSISFWRWLLLLHKVTGHCPPSSF